MNPLAIPGPYFLVLYAALAVLLTWMTYRRIAARESTLETRLMKVRDPYAIAYLRGGVNQLTQVAVLALIRRGLLLHDKVTLKARSETVFAGSAPIEAAVLSACRTFTRGSALRREIAVEAAAAAYDQLLVDGHLVPTDEMRSQRYLTATWTAGILACLAFAKLGWATAHGRQNIGLLIISLIVAVSVQYLVAARRRTQAGDRSLEHLKVLFARVKRAPTPVGPDQLNEALLLAAVFGRYAAPGIPAQRWRSMFAPPQSNGSSCGGSCGGGGGCGGGGCGGCGS